MKTRPFIGSLPRGIKHAVNLLTAVLLFVCAREVRAASAAELLERGIYTEETKGDLKAATEIYGQIVDDPAAGRALLAQAQLRLGLCQLKLGNKPQAISALERLTHEFPDNEKLLAIIEHHMPQVLDDMLKQIEQRYIHEVDRSDLMETAFRAIAGKLDATSGTLRANDLTFLDAKEVSQLNESMEQKVAGIGIALKVDEATRGIIVATVLPRSPALKSGVLAGDRIVHVNDIELPTEGTLEKTVKLLRGPAGSPVTVSVKRNGADQLVRIQLVRDVIQLASVKGHRLKTDGNWEFMLDGERKVGYIRLEYLGNQSPEEMRSALNDVKLRGMKALVLDLRNNPGGSLDDAIKVADLFIETGRIVTVKGRSGEKAYDAAPEGTFLGFPIAVLVNRKSASAAEIVAACLQDHGRAVVVGERTVGQGIVRSIMPLKGGLGALKLPVAAYYRPSGKNVNRYPHSTDGEDWGVMPNVGYEISMTDDEMKEFEAARFAREAINAQTPELEDRQLQKALEYSARILAQ